PRNALLPTNCGLLSTLQAFAARPPLFGPVPIGFEFPHHSGIGWRGRQARIYTLRNSQRPRMFAPYPTIVAFLVLRDLLEQLQAIFGLLLHPHIPLAVK